VAICYLYTVAHAPKTSKSNPLYIATAVWASISPNNCFLRDRLQKKLLILYVLVFGCVSVLHTVYPHRF